ncbi:MAG: arsenite methyltransferase [Candidatus Latescibacteria bacterium]|nr:arsenite methyltransferase [Candidatus Latescibacterota bacterium]
MLDTDRQIKDAVKEGYTRAIEQDGSCCACSCDGPQSTARELGYAEGDLDTLPEGATENSFGCGNPLAFTGVEPGQTVLDIGSGAGLDCLIAADRVGPSGRVIGLDMTPAMIDKARTNATEAGLTQIEFRLGEADQMPVEDNSVDWVISNCVINLAPDKYKVFAEVARTLKPGGRVSISDIVLSDELPGEVVSHVDALVGCIGGAIKEGDYLDAMRRAGLVEATVTERAHYGAEQLEGFLQDDSADLKQWAARLDGRVWSARIHGRKP